MRPLFTLLLFAACLSACETTRVTETNITEHVRPVKVKPVIKEQDSDFDLEGKYSEAALAYENEDYKLSLDIYQEILIYDPSELPAQIELANTLIARGNYNSAKIVFETIKAEDLTEKQHNEIDIGLILTQVLSGNTEAPLPRIHDGIEMDPKDPRLWNAKGNAHDRKEEWLESQDAYLMAMSLDGAYAGTINNMGMSLLKQGRYNEALEKFDQALEIKPGHLLYDNNYRLTLIMLDDLGSALFGLSDRDGANILNDAGFILMKKGNLNGAKYLFTQAIQLSPNYHIKAHENLKNLQF